MRKVTQFLLTLALLVAPLGSVAYAQDPVCSVAGAPASGYCENSDSDADGSDFIGNDGILNTAVNLLTMVAAIVSLIGIVLGGFMYTTSSGDPSKAAKARSTIIYALVGLVVAVMARVIVSFILFKIDEG